MFFHKDGAYVRGVTPLVCWLKPTQVAPVLQLQALDVHPAFSAQTPDTPAEKQREAAAVCPSEDMRT